MMLHHFAQRLLFALVLCATFLPQPGQAGVTPTLFEHATRFPVALEDGRLVWKDGRYVDPDGVIDDYWVTADAIYLSVETALDILVKRLDPTVPTLTVLARVPAGGAVRFTSMGLFMLVPEGPITSNPVWSVLVQPFEAESPQVLMRDAIKPHLAAFDNGVILKHGTNLWMVSPTLQTTLLDAQVEAWTPAPDHFRQADYWGGEPSVYRLLLPRPPGAFYARRSGQLYLLDRTLQPVPVRLPKDWYPLPWHPIAAQNTGFIAVWRPTLTGRDLALFDYGNARLVSIRHDWWTKQAPNDPDSLFWMMTDDGPVALHLEQDTLYEINLTTGAKSTRLSQRESLTVAQTDRAWYAKSDSATWVMIGNTQPVRDSSLDERLVPRVVVGPKNVVSKIPGPGPLTAKTSFIQPTGSLPGLTSSKSNTTDPFGTPNDDTQTTKALIHPIPSTTQPIPYIPGTAMPRPSTATSPESVPTSSPSRQSEPAPSATSRPAPTSITPSMPSVRNVPPPSTPPAIQAPVKEEPSTIRSACLKATRANTGVRAYPALTAPTIATIGPDHQFVEETHRMIGATRWSQVVTENGVGWLPNTQVTSVASCTP